MNRNGSAAVPNFGRGFTWAERKQRSALFVQFSKNICENRDFQILKKTKNKLRSDWWVLTLLIINYLIKGGITYCVGKSFWRENVKNCDFVNNSFQKSGFDSLDFLESNEKIYSCNLFVTTKKPKPQVLQFTNSWI